MVRFQPWERTVWLMTEKKQDISSPPVDPKDAKRIEDYGHDAPDEDNKKKDS